MARKLKYDVKRALTEWKARSKKILIKTSPTFNRIPPVWQSIQTNELNEEQDKNTALPFKEQLAELTKHDILLPKWEGTVFEEIINDYNAFGARFRIMQPRASISIHVDGWTPVYIFPILSNKNAFYITGDKKLASSTHAWMAWHHSADGSIYKTDHTLFHAAMNGHEKLIKVIFQFRSKDDL